MIFCSLDIFTSALACPDNTAKQCPVVTTPIQMNSVLSPEILRQADKYVEHKYPGYRADKNHHWSIGFTGFSHTYSKKWDSISVQLTWDGYILIGDEIVGEWIDWLK
jgi:hypothetical protein